jgi:hypothetical protein
VRILRMMVVVLAVIWFPVTVDAQYAWVGLWEDPTATSCGILDQGVQLKQIYVVVSESSGITAAQFAAPKPTCFPATYLSDSQVFPLTIGNSQTGVSIGFGACKTSRVHCLTIMYFTSGTTEGCCPYRVKPHPYAESGQVEFVDCADHLFFGTAGATYITKTGQLPPLVDNAGPADGAIEQPLDTKLSWTVFRCDCLLSIVLSRVYFGTTPEPPLVTGWEDLYEYAYDPGPLAPNTTYYWKIQTSIGYSLETTTPVWSFSTMADVAVKPTTWGRVKSLYGE